MVDSVVNFLLQRLPQLIEGASFPSRVEDEVKSFQRELERINVLKSGGATYLPLNRMVSERFALWPSEQSVSYYNLSKLQNGVRAVYSKDR